MASVLRAVLQKRHLASYLDFIQAYDRCAETVDPLLVGRGPTKTQFYRWCAGELLQLPRAHHCRILEVMLPTWTAEELFAKNMADESAPDRSSVVAVRPSRIISPGVWPLESLFDGVQDIAVAGISLNVLCQQTSDRQLVRVLESGARVRALFLDPDGAHMAIREREIGYTPGALQTMTALNMRALQRLRSTVAPDAADRLEIRTYDEPPRFHLIIVNSFRCVVAPYLPDRRGVDSPSFAIDDLPEHEALWRMFCDVYDGLWVRSEAV